MNFNTGTCAVHGDFESAEFRPGRWTACPACARQQRKLEEEQAQERLRVEKVAELLRSAGLAGRFIDATFDSFNASTHEQITAMTTVRNFALNFVRGSGRSLWLVGPPGTGKTHLGSACARAVIEQHAVGAMLTSPAQIVRRVRATWRRGSTGETEDDVISDIASVPLLILDEVGTSACTDAERAQLFEPLDNRYALCGATLVLSNLAPADIRTALGDRLFDRLRERATVIAMAWPSYRPSIE